MTIGIIGAAEEEAMLRAQLVALHEDYRRLAAPLVRRLMTIERTRAQPRYVLVDGTHYVRVEEGDPPAVAPRVGGRV